MFSLPFQVEESIVISKPIEKVFETLADFNTWKTWSPWVCQEPDCQITIEGQPQSKNHSQTWIGKRIGEGSMTLTGLDAPKKLDYDLEIIKPWKSSSKVSLQLEQQADQTKVSWSMHGSVPIFMFFMKKMMSSMIGCDYERGLKMLKDLNELGSVSSASNITPKVESQGFLFVGKKSQASMKEFEEAMQLDYNKLLETFSNDEYGETIRPACLYHEFNPMKNSVQYSLGYIMKNCNKYPKSFYKQTFPQHQALQVEHTGPYRHLGNGWSTAMTYLRHHKLKFNKAIPMYEIYTKVEGEIDDESQLETQIHIPIK